MGYDTNTTWPGVLAHHAESCPRREGGRCTCGVTGYRARVDDPLQDEPVLGPIFPTVNEADRWRREQQAATDAWHAVTGGGETVSDVIDAFLDGISAGHAVDERGAPRPPEELTELRWSLRALQGVEAADGHGLLGDLPIARLDAAELRALVARLDAAGLSHRRTRSVIGALRALLRFAAHRGLVPPSAAEMLVFGGPDEPLPPPAPAPEPAPPTGMAAILAGPPTVASANGNGTGPAAAVPTPYPAPTPTPYPAPPPYPTPAPYATPAPGAFDTPYATPAPGMLATPMPPTTTPVAPLLPPAAPATAANGAIPDEVIWLILKIVALVFALIALVLVAESV
jgi:hypothetical protein